MPYQLESKNIYFIGDEEVRKLTCFEHKTENVQNYDAIKESGKQFLDPEFPHNDDSIGYIETLFDPANRSCIAKKKKGFTGMVDWLRIQDFVDKMSKCKLSFGASKTFTGAKILFMEDDRGKGITKMEVNHGAIIDSWFVGSLSELVLDEPTHLSFVVPPDNKTSINGVYHFRYWYQGLWLDIVVDDYLPFIRYNYEGTKYWTPLGGELVVNESNFVEIWVALAEKAYAKLLGSYKSINGHPLWEVLEAMTGGISESYKIKEQTISPLDLYEKTVYLFEKGTKKLILGTTSDPSGAKFGLRYPHAYSVLSVATVHSYGEEIKLIKLRNPHGRGNKEWTGKWSDQEDVGFGPELASEWIGVSAEEQKSIGLVAGDDGEFWIQVEDFMKYFNSIEVCHLVPEVSLHTESASSVLYSELHGQRNEQEQHSESDWQYSLVEGGSNDASSPCTLIVNVIYKKKIEKGKIPQIGVSVYAATDEFKGQSLRHNVFLELEEIDATKDGKLFSNSVSNTFRVEIKPGRYAVVPKILDSDSGEHGSFLLRVLYLSASLT